MVNLNWFPIFVAAFLVMGIPFSPAQEPGLTESLTEETLPQSPSNWRYICDEAVPLAENGCYLRYVLNVLQTTNGEERVLKLLTATVLYVANGQQTEPPLYLSLSLPLGIDLRPGAILKVDEGEKLSLPFLQCTQEGCDVSLVIDADFLAALKQGKILYIGFRPWGSSETGVLEASLMGFTRAFANFKN